MHLQENTFQLHYKKFDCPIFSSSAVYTLQCPDKLIINHSAQEKAGNQHHDKAKSHCRPVPFFVLVHSTSTNFMYSEEGHENTSIVTATIYLLYRTIQSHIKLFIFPLMFLLYTIQHIYITASWTILYCLKSNNNEYLHYVVFSYF